MLDTKLIKNTLNLIFSNTIVLLINIMSAFITPAILGTNGFGYYKMFMLYIGYVPLLHFGFIDGILISNAGKSMSEINNSKFRTYSLFIVIFEFIISSIMLSSIFFIRVNNINKEIIFFIAVYSFLLNIVNYFQLFSKAIMRFSELAASTRFQSYLYLAFLIIGFILYSFTDFQVNVTYYMFYYCLTQMILLAFYLFRYKNIVFGKRIHFKIEKYNICQLFKSGFMIVLSYQITLLMINADNQFISISFNISDYSEYAFAFSLASLLITVFSSISSVVLPYMKQMGKEIIVKKHTSNISILYMIVFLILSAYYPIVIIVKIFLKDYIQSISFLSIVFPVVGITCIIQSYLFNDYIMLKKTKIFCYISLINLLIDYMAYYHFNHILHSTKFIALCSVPLIIIWYISLEYYLKRTVKTHMLKNVIYIIIMTILFICINHLFSVFIGLMVYIFIYLIITICFFYKLIITLINRI